MKSADALYALDRATRAIAGELDLDRVLQLIVDSVRELVGARYAALGIVNSLGRIERFLTSGISAELRESLGAPPQGHGLLGVIIREGLSIRIPDITKHPNSYGFPPGHPEMRSLLGVPIPVAGRALGNLYLTDKIDAPEFSAADQELVEIFALHAGIALQNARLHQQVQQLAIVDERLRISRDLHDGIIQSLYAAGLSLEDVPELIHEDQAEALARVDRAIDRLNTTIADIRQFIVGLDPTGEIGLSEAMLAQARELTVDTPVRMEVDLEGVPELERRLPPEATHELLQIAREAISNVARHSRAQRAQVTLRVESGAAVLRIEDEGIGFDPSRHPGPGHLGLTNLRERAAGLGGALRIDSEPGKGTRIILNVPLAPLEISS